MAAAAVESPLDLSNSKAVAAVQREGSTEITLGGGGGGGGGGSELYMTYLTRAAAILTTFSKSNGVVKEGLAEEKCLQGVSV